MNTLTSNGASHPFSTVDELTAIVRAMPGRESVTHLYRDGLTLVGLDDRLVMHIIGTLAGPVALSLSQEEKS